jgi:hypothetical protein
MRVSDETSAPTNVNPGDRIAGYRLEEQIGQGGMAVVYRAVDERLDRRVALKLLTPGLAADNAFRTRFIRESRAAAAVDHPNIIPVYDAGDAGGFLFIAMRYVQGGDVRSLFSAGQPIPPARVWNIISQVAAALDAAHAHDLIHRDVKPGNMLLDTSGGRTAGSKPDQLGDQADHVYLSDFGISKQTLASHLTSTGQFVGTLDYIAPEQIEGQDIDGRVDQYSLGCATYELLTGEPPFRRELGLALINAHLSTFPPSARAKRPDLPASVDQVLAKAMAKLPDQRYATCTEFATDLGKAVGMIPGTPMVVAALPPTVAQAKAGAGDGDQAGGHPVTERADPAVAAAGIIPQQATPAPPVVAAAVPVPQPVAGQPAEPPLGGGYDAATQFAPGPAPGQTAPTPGEQPGGRLGGDWQNYPAGYGPAQQQYGPYQGGPGGPGAPGWPQQPPPRKKSRGVLVGAVIGVIAVAAIAAAVVYYEKSGGHSNAGGNTPTNSSSSHSSSSPSAAARSEATGISTLLLNSANSRLQWNSNTLTNDVGHCVSIGSDVTQIGDIARERQNELQLAQGLRTSAIANGATLKSQLTAALQISLNIDNDYLAWARQQQSSGCTVGTNSSYYRMATNEDPHATADKMTFVGTWDPIAGKYDLEQFSAGQI